MKLPNFLVVGAAKSGTTSLYGFLKQHPEVFIPDIKECRFFSNIQDNINPFTGEQHAIITKSFDDYKKLYMKAKREKAIGEVSPDYLFYYKNSINNIKNYLGNDVKIIIILRNPIKRAFSNYLHIIREEEVSLSFEEVLKLEDKWINKKIWYGFLCKYPSFYYDSVKAYLENFENVKILFFEEFIVNINFTLKEICDFLEIDNSFSFKKPAFTNKTGVPENIFIEKLFKTLVPYAPILKKLFPTFVYEKFVQMREKNLKKPILKEDTISFLKKIFEDDIRKLSILLNKDLEKIWKLE